MIEILINFKDTYGMARKNVKHNIDIYIKSNINSNTCSYTYTSNNKNQINPKNIKYIRKKQRMKVHSLLVYKQALPQKKLLV